MGLPVWIGCCSPCSFVTATDELARAKTLEEIPEAEVVRRAFVEAIAFALDVVVAFGSKVVGYLVAEVLFMPEILGFDPKVPPSPLPPKIA